MTLMPVWKTSIVGSSSSRVGAGRWIGQRSLASTSSPSSIGSPRTLKMRPRVGSPTGTEIGARCPRRPRAASPSVESMATARTRSLPRCCWTSAIRSKAGRPSCSGTAMRRAWKISGKLVVEDRVDDDAPDLHDFPRVVRLFLSQICSRSLAEPVYPAPLRKVRSTLSLLDQALGRAAGLAGRRVRRDLLPARDLAELAESASGS